MDLRRIRHFVVLAETLNFRRAAEKLHMAQPPLSVSIQKLEAQLGTKLFLREATGVSLTASGRAVLPEAHKLLFHGHQFAETARSALKGTGGVLRIGFVGTTTWGMLQRLVPAFHADHPGVELVLHEATSVAIVQQLEDGALDVGLLRAPLLQSTRATLVPLEHDRFVAALPRGHPQARKRSLPLSALADEPFVMYAPSAAAGLHAAAMLACQDAGFVPKVSQHGVQVQTLLALVESGLGIGLVPSLMRRYASDRIVYRPLTDLSPASVIALMLAYVADKETAAGALFREAAVRMAED